MKKVLLFVILFCGLPAHAGYVELSGSFGYRKTYQDSTDYTTYRSITGSLAYYFWELSALEFSYTRAREDENYVDYQTSTFVEFYETDFIFTLAHKDSVFQPYIKMGAAYQVKKSTYAQKNVSPIDLPTVKGWGPSGGLGFKVMLNDFIAIKSGLDVWSSPLGQDPVTYDYAFRAGLSFIF